NAINDCPIRNFSLLLANPSTHHILSTTTDIDTLFGYSPHELTTKDHTLKSIITTPKDIPKDMPEGTSICTDPTGPGTCLTFQGRRKDGTTVWFDACIHIINGCMCWLIRNSTLLYQLSSNRPTYYRTLLARYLPPRPPKPAPQPPQQQKPTLPPAKYFYQNISPPPRPAYKSIFVITSTGVIDHVYPSVAGFLNQTAKELISRPIMGFVHPGDIVALCGCFSKLVKLRRMTEPVVVRWRVDLDGGTSEPNSNTASSPQTHYIQTELTPLPLQPDTLLIFLRVLDPVAADGVFGLPPTVPAREELRWWWWQLVDRVLYLVERCLRKGVERCLEFGLGTGLCVLVSFLQFRMVGEMGAFLAAIFWCSDADSWLFP
ncbi:hypothetical protein HDV00_007399, partial [Rhizophlyctis rosea]